MIKWIIRINISFYCVIALTMYTKRTMVKVDDGEYSDKLDIFCVCELMCSFDMKLKNIRNIWNYKLNRLEYESYNTTHIVWPRLWTWIVSRLCNVEHWCEPIWFGFCNFNRQRHKSHSSCQQWFWIEISLLKRFPFQCIAKS